ncbi:ArnT family glycosyltransferase [Trinickia dinghuensis]|uniref:Glycosyl transferase n=1 Tax=Trinickia dinghuensis TaxID=2291023 RepID=A0A3D8JTL8_9BURK|nr:glycosyl transferase [Trinickia dinghuensis]RDU96449.1 glycosyl transferase [Trinickia dinghuensis]
MPETSDSARRLAPVRDAFALPFAARYGLQALLALAAVLCAYLLIGTVGHDPWKQDETYTFGIIQHMLETGDLVVPINAGQPFVEKPPLYDWVAAGLAWLGRGWLPLHDAARLASALFTALALACVAHLARRIARARSVLDLRVLGTLALFGTTLLVIKHTHDMMTDVALMAGAALGLAGLYELVAALDTTRRAIDGRIDRGAADRAALAFGAGVGITFMTKGLFLPLVFGATLCALPVLYPACRGRDFARAIGVAAFVFAPFALIWPIAFYCRSPELFKVWFWDNNVGRFFGFSVQTLGSGNDKPFFIWRVLLTAAFPAGPLAFAALATGAWRRLRTPGVAIPAVFAAVGIAVLQVSATARELYLLPFIAPLALIAGQELERWPRVFHVAWDYASRVLFGAAAVLTWLVWSEMTDAASTHAKVRWLGRWLPLDWTLPIHPSAVLTGLALTLGWLWAMPRLRLTGSWRGAFSWAAGVMLVWGLVFTLLLPWIDEAKSYRSVFEDLSLHLDSSWRADDCMASLDLGESEAPMLYYFAGVLHRPIADADVDETRCRWLIVQGRHTDFDPGVTWTPVWSGARPGDNDELLRVFLRRRMPIEARTRDDG